MTAPLPSFDGAPPPLAATREDPAARAVLSSERLAEIARLGLDVPDQDTVLAEALREASTRLELPMALVTVVLDDAQIFLAHRGLPDWLADAGGTPVEWSFCRYQVASGAPFVVTDATRDPRVADNPLVTIDGVRCYAGAPLVTARGHVIGSLCVLGDRARAFTEAEVETLRRLARDVVRHLEARAAATPAHD